MASSLASALATLPKPTLKDAADLLELLKQWAITHPVAAAAAATALYIFGMLVYRCGVEGKTTVRPPAPKGWVRL